MAKMRHWKQRWSPDHDFVFRRRVNLDGSFTSPGDPVPKGRFSVARLRRWWEAGLIEIADWVPPHEAQKKAPVVQPRGQGWYHVYWRGKTHRLRGREAVDAFVQEALASPKAA